MCPLRGPSLRGCVPSDCDSFLLCGFHDVLSAFNSLLLRLLWFSGMAAHNHSHINCKCSMPLYTLPSQEERRQFAQCVRKKNKIQGI